MSIILHCNLCGEEVEGSENVILELQHWLIVRWPHGEEHFCRECKQGQKDLMEAQNEQRA